MTSPSMGWYLTGVPTTSQYGATMGVGQGLGQNSSGQMTADPYQGIAQLIEQQSAEATKRADEQYGIQKQQLLQQYNAAKLTAKTAEERNAIEKWFNEQNVKLAQDRLAEEHRQFDITNSLNQAKLGYDVLGMANNMRGANNYVQASNMMRGVAGMPETPTFLNSLQTNTRLPSFVGQAGSPDAYTMNSLVSQLTGASPAGAGTSTSGAGGTQGASGGYTVNGFVNQTHALAQAGGGRLGAGALEQLSPDELGLLQSGIEAPDSQGKAFNYADFLDQYKKSRINQSIGSGYAGA